MQNIEQRYQDREQAILMDKEAQQMQQLKSKCANLMQTARQNVSIHTGTTTKTQIMLSAEDKVLNGLQEGTLRLDDPEIIQKVAEIISEEVKRFEKVLGRDC